MEQFRIQAYGRTELAQIYVAVAMGRLEIAVLISVFMVGIFYFARPLKKTLDNQSDAP